MNVLPTSKHGLPNGGARTTAAALPTVANNSAVLKITPASGLALAKNVVIKTANPTITNLVVKNDSKQVEIKKNDVQSSVQLRTDDNKKIIISGAKSVKDIPVNVLQQILSNVKNVQPNQTVLVINQNNPAPSIQNKEVKSYESIVKDVLQDLPQSNDIGLENTSHNNVTETKACVKDSTSNNRIKSDPIVVPKDVQNNETKTTISENPSRNNKESKTTISQNVTKLNNSKSVVCNNERNVKSSSTNLRNDVTQNNTLQKTTKDEKNLSKNSNQDKLPEDNLLKNQSATKPVLAVAPRQAPQTAPKQKKFLYRLKSKNGKVLSYVSDAPIVLKKPIIRLDKMTPADAERLSEQFAAEKKQELRKSARLVQSSIYLSESNTNSTPQQSSGVKTRKRQLKFLPDGRLLRDKKSKFYVSSDSSLSSLDDDTDKPVVTSDDDYNGEMDVPATMSSDEDIVKDIPIKPTSSKKITPPKKVTPEKSLPLNNSIGTQSGRKTVREKSENLINPTPSVTPQQKPVLNTTPVQKKPTVEAATVFATLLKMPISLDQLNVRRFKPKIKPAQGNTSGTFMFKKIFTPGLKQMIPSLKTSPNASASNFAPPLSRITPAGGYKPASIKPTLPNSDIWPAKNIPQRNQYKMVSYDPPPLTPISRRESSIPQTFKTPTSINSIPNQSIDILTKFDDFTNSKIVKTKEGPKKAAIKEMKKCDEPRTIYDIMEELFDSMPHWNIHVIPENKSFCLAQISLGRTGIPVLKKSIEINSEFMVKVYVHQLHCKRYDGIYDTESKIKKLIQDVDAVAI